MTKRVHFQSFRRYIKIADFKYVFPFYNNKPAICIFLLLFLSNQLQISSYLDNDWFLDQYYRNMCFEFVLQLSKKYLLCESWTVFFNTLYVYINVNSSITIICILSRKFVLYLSFKNITLSSFLSLSLPTSFCFKFWSLNNFYRILSSRNMWHDLHMHVDIFYIRR